MKWRVVKGRATRTGSLVGGDSGPWVRGRRGSSLHHQSRACRARVRGVRAPPRLNARSLTSPRYCFSLFARRGARLASERIGRARRFAAAAARAPAAAHRRRDGARVDVERVDDGALRVRVHLAFAQSIDNLGAPGVRKVELGFAPVNGGCQALRGDIHLAAGCSLCAGVGGKRWKLSLEGYPISSRFEVRRKVMLSCREALGPELGQAHALQRGKLPSRACLHPLAGGKQRPPACREKTIYVWHGSPNSTLLGGRCWRSHSHLSNEHVAPASEHLHARVQHKCQSPICHHLLEAWISVPVQDDRMKQGRLVDAGVRKLRARAGLCVCLVVGMQRAGASA